MTIREKKHRLPKEFYKGTISVAFTLCIKGSLQAFTRFEIVNTFTDILAPAVAKRDCIVPVYCFMPNHQHVIITGTKSDSNIWDAVVDYKQRTGFWMSMNRVGFVWQKDFYDHVIRKSEDIAVQVRYILDNPVRKGIVASWQEYPFKGSIGCKLEDVLTAII